MTKAHKWLVEIYSKHIVNDTAKAEHELFLKDNIKGELNIITGLIGSGFEEILEELVNNGIGAEQNNSAKNLWDKFLLPKTKKLHLESDWLKEIGSNLLYVQPQFLSFLPPNFNYKLIVVKRDMKEVIEIELKIMGKRIKKETLPIVHFHKNEKNLFKIDSWIESQPNIEISINDFAEFNSNSKEQIDQLINFLG